MKLIRRLALVAAASVVACNSPTGGENDPPAKIVALPRQLTAVEQEMVGAANSFGFNLLREVNGTFADSNVFLSPLSASMALGMAMNGAQGATFTEMRSTLGFGPRTYAELNASYQSLIALLRGLDSKVQFTIGNAVFYEKSFAPSIEATFLADARQYFDAKATGLDFLAPASLDTINRWASDNTNGKIPKILDELKRELVMLLMNAIYFKGDWRDQFKKSDTHDLPFTKKNGTAVQVATMFRKGGFRLGNTSNAMVIELPYGGDAFVMTVLLPNTGTTVDQVITSLTPSSWASAVSNLNDSSLELYMPKFRLAWEDSLNDDLKDLGMRQAFIKDGADFTRLSATMGHKLYIDFVKQKAFVDVNEEGTEAAAVTVVGIGVTSLPVPVRIDRPFVFAIRERLSGTVLFLGKIIEPKVN